jgi:hypothetical protein
MGGDITVNGSKDRPAYYENVKWNTLAQNSPT